MLDREAVLEQFKQAEAPAILVSPSMGTGVSLDYDLARYAIIAKMPFPDQGDKLVAKRLQTGGKKVWYQYATAAELVQSSGRIVRADDDWGITYILDANFGWFMKGNKHLFPQWWMDAVEARSL
jgi:Rad3-related DNA helicase